MKIEDKLGMSILRQASEQAFFKVHNFYVTKGRCVTTYSVGTGSADELLAVTGKSVKDDFSVSGKSCRTMELSEREKGRLCQKKCRISPVVHS